MMRAGAFFFLGATTGSRGAAIAGAKKGGIARSFDSACALQTYGHLWELMMVLKGLVDRAQLLPEGMVGATAFQPLYVVSIHPEWENVYGNWLTASFSLFGQSIKRFNQRISDGQTAHRDALAVNKNVSPWRCWVATPPVGSVGVVQPKGS